MTYVVRSFMIVDVEPWFGINYDVIAKILRFQQNKGPKRRRLLFYKRKLVFQKRGGKKVGTGGGDREEEAGPSGLQKSEDDTSLITSPIFR